MSVDRAWEVDAREWLEGRPGRPLQVPHGLLLKVAFGQEWNTWPPELWAHVVMLREVRR